MLHDTALFDLIEAEGRRQKDGIELIASENYVSDDVMRAMGSCLTNKYAEGYPGRRYYGGCQVVDQVESLAIERIKQLFGAEYANVQPHSGASQYDRVPCLPSARRQIHRPQPEPWRPPHPRQPRELLRPRVPRP